MEMSLMSGACTQTLCAAVVSTHRSRRDKPFRNTTSISILSMRKYSSQARKMSLNHKPRPLTIRKCRATGRKRYSNRKRSGPFQLQAITKTTQTHTIYTSKRKQNVALSDSLSLTISRTRLPRFRRRLRQITRASRREHTVHRL
jgi:hypothetical protein